MAKENQRLEQEFIESARAKTGHSVEEWMPIVGASGLQKQTALVAWLKETHKLNHMQATFLTGIYLNDGKPVYDYEVLFNKLFEGKETLLPTYRALESNVTAALPDAEFVPTRAYVSIEAKKIFACATMTPKLIRVGLDLGEMPFDSYVQKAKSLGAMPNLTHMVEITSPTEVNDRLLDLVHTAYRRVHPK